VTCNFVATKVLFVDIILWPFVNVDVIESTGTMSESQALAAVEAGDLATVRRLVDGGIKITTANEVH
jgi:hypothetical protein